MGEVVGVAAVGSTSISEIMASSAEREVVAAVLAGGSAVTYVKGQALIDSATNGKAQKYTNATAVNDEAVATGDGSTATFDLANSNVIASTLKGYDADVQENVSLSVGTGTGGVDQIVFATAPANAAAVTADYTCHASANGVSGACILLTDEATTVAGSDVVANALVGGSVRSGKIVDSAGNEVDSFFKAALNNVRFV